MHRPRHRRKDPRRTRPLRSAGEAWRQTEPPEDSWEPEDSWDVEDDDPASYGVRVGSSVIEEQIRRGRRAAEDLHRESRGRRGHYHGGYRPGSWHGDEEPRYRHGYEPWPGYGDRGRRGLLGMPMRHLERLLREILHQIVSVRPDPWRLAELLIQLQIEAISELARLGFGALGMMGPRWGDSFDEDVDRVTRDIDEGYEYDDEDDDEPWIDEPRHWPAAPSTPTTIRTTVPIPVYVSSHQRTEIELTLPAGSQSLDLEIEPTLVAGATRPTRPPFAAELVAFEDGPAILIVEVPRDLPAGRYQRRILVRATGDPVGELIVQLGDLPLESQEASGEQAP